MPAFAYRAKTGPRNIISGIIQAEDMKQALAKIIRAGQTPLEVKPYDEAQIVAAPAETAGKASSVRVPQETVGIFTRQMYDMLDADVPLFKALDLLVRQERNQDFKAVIEQMRISVQGGADFSDALRDFPSVFPALYISMVKAGEMGGGLAEVMGRLSDFIEKDLEFRAKVTGSLLYPFIVFGVGVLTICVLLTFVLPRLSAIFEDFDTALPWATQMVMGMSAFFAQYWLLLTLVSGVAAYAALRYIQSAPGRLRIDEFVLRVPVLNGFILHAEMARFARTMATLLDSGIAIPTALESTLSVLENTKIKEQLRKASYKVRGGSSLASAIKGSAAFPEMLANLITIGEQSGKLQRSLHKMAATCERVTAQDAQRFITILGPAVLIVVVATVGFMIVAMLLPIFQMNTIIH